MLKMSVTVGLGMFYFC